MTQTGLAKKKICITYFCMFLGLSFHDDTAWILFNNYARIYHLISLQQKESCKYEPLNSKCMYSTRLSKHADKSL